MKIKICIEIPRLGMTEIACWINNQSQRKYRLLIGTDLFGQQIIIKEWGSLTKARNSPSRPLQRIRKRLDGDVSA